MEVLHGLAGLDALPRGAALSVGNFDGVHVGHVAVVRALVARALPSVAVVTFEPHPLTVLRPAAAPPRLTTFARKRALLEALGATHLVVLPPSDEVLSLEAEAFYERLRATEPGALVEGNDFNFGRGRRGTSALLAEWARRDGVDARVLADAEATLPDRRVVAVSSTLVRWLVGHGRVMDAAACLGRAYAIEGVVVEGQRRGRTLGFPTANVDAGDLMLPADGVYAGRAIVGERAFPTAVNVGSQPTFEQVGRTVEAHLIGFEGDLYGRGLTIELTRWVRDVRRFAGVEALRAQIARDVRAALV